MGLFDKLIERQIKPIEYGIKIFMEILRLTKMGIL